MGALEAPPAASHESTQKKKGANFFFAIKRLGKKGFFIYKTLSHIAESAADDANLLLRWWMREILLGDSDRFEYGRRFWFTKREEGHKKIKKEERSTLSENLSLTATRWFAGVENF